MTNENEAGGGLAAWRKTERWREEGATDIFPTRSSLDWFLRQNGNELIAEGHLIPGTGRRGSLVGPGIDDAVIAILRREAGRRCGSGEAN